MPKIIISNILDIKEVQSEDGVEDYISEIIQQEKIINN